MTPGQAAFEKWNDLVNPAHKFMWDNLSDEGKKKWEEIAKAAALVYIEQHDMHS